MSCFFHYLSPCSKASFEHNICVSHQICPWRSMFPWELRSIDCSERTEITTLFVIGKGKEGRKGRKNQKCGTVTSFSHLPKSFIFERASCESPPKTRHEVVITFLLPLLKTRTWELQHEIVVQNHMKTTDVNMKRHERRRWKSFVPFKLLLTPFCYWLYCAKVVGVEGKLDLYKLGPFFLMKKLKSSLSWTIWRLSTSPWLDFIGQNSLI